MNKYNSVYIKALIILVTLILLLFSIVFYLERNICLDSPIYLMNMINKGSYHLPTNRFIAIFTQILPLIFIKLGASLKIIAISYSINYFLFHLTLVFVILFKFKDYASALLLIFAHVLAGNYLFYYPVSEYQMGLSLLVFFISYLLYISRNKLIKFKPLQIIFLFLLIITIQYAHPLMLPISIFFTIYISIENQIIKKKHALYILGLILTIAIVKWSISTAEYDVNKANQMSLVSEFFPFFWKANSFKYFIHTTKHFNYFFLLYIVIIPFYLIKKEYLKLFLFASFSISYLFLVMIVNFNEIGNEQYTEHLYQAISLYIAIPFIYEILHLLNSRLMLGFLVIFFAIKLNTIYHFNEHNGDRIDWIKEQFANHKGNTKLLIDSDLTEPKLNNAIWVIAVESLLISAIDEDLPTGTIQIIRNHKNLESKTSNPDVFLTTWFNYSIDKDMSKKYFNLDNSFYKHIEKK